MFMMYFLIYAAMAVVGTYLPLYFSTARGFTPTQIGYILAAAPVVAIAAQMFWGNIADMVKSKNKLLSIILILLCVSMALLPLGKIFVLALIFQCIYAFFDAPSYSLTDTIITENCNKLSLNFGRIRLAGTIGFGVIGWIAGIVMGINIYLMFPMYLILMLCAQIPLRRMPVVAGHRQSKTKINPLSLLKDKRLCFIYAICAAVAIPVNFIFAFFSIYLTSPAVGGQTWQVGMYLFLSVVMEIPLLFNLDRIIKRFGIENIMLMSLFMLCLRFFFLGFVTNPYILIFSGALQCSYVTFFVGAALYISRYVNPGLKATGQAFSSILMAGVAKIISSLVAGILIDALGYASTYMICAIYATIILIIAIPVYHLYIKKLDLPKEQVV